VADVFLSYARAEREWALVRLGVSVFYDVDGIDGGDVFPDILDREVKSAAVVLGLWSPYSLTRPWVRAECDIGRARQVLVPAAIAPIEPMQIPANFWNIQYFDLSRFDGRADNAEFAKTVRAIGRILKRPDLEVYMKPKGAESPPRSGPAAPLLNPQPPPPPRPQRGVLKAVIAGGVMASAVAMIIYMNIPQQPPAAAYEEFPYEEFGEEEYSDPAMPVADPAEEHGQVVARIQKTLNDLGFEVGYADGVAGAETMRALAEYAAMSGEDLPDLSVAPVDSLLGLEARLLTWTPEDHAFQQLVADPASIYDCFDKQYRIFFGGGAAGLSDDGASLLTEAYSNTPQGCYISSVRIVAYDDVSGGNYARATVLAWRRSRSVLRPLLARGFDAGRVGVYWSGKPPYWAADSAGSLNSMANVVELKIFYGK
jgi:hypothetical protein